MRIRVLMARAVSAQTCGDNATRISRTRIVTAVRFEAESGLMDRVARNGG